MRETRSQVNLTRHLHNMKGKNEPNLCGEQVSLTGQVFNFLLNLVQSFSQRAGDENFWVEGSKARPKHPGIQACEE